MRLLLRLGHFLPAEVSFSCVQNLCLRQNQRHYCKTWCACYHKQAQVPFEPGGCVKNRIASKKRTEPHLLLLHSRNKVICVVCVMQAQICSLGFGNPILSAGIFASAFPSFLAKVSHTSPTDGKSAWVPFPLLGLLELCQLAYLQYWVLCLTHSRLALFSLHLSVSFMASWSGFVVIFDSTEVCFDLFHRLVCIGGRSSLNFLVSVVMPRWFPVQL